MKNFTKKFFPKNIFWNQKKFSKKSSKIEKYFLGKIKKHFFRKYFFLEIKKRTFFQKFHQEERKDLVQIVLLSIEK